MDLNIQNYFCQTRLWEKVHAIGEDDGDDSVCELNPVIQQLIN